MISSNLTIKEFVNNLESVQYYCTKLENALMYTTNELWDVNNDWLNLENYFLVSILYFKYDKLNKESTILCQQECSVTIENLASLKISKKKLIEKQNSKEKYNEILK